MVGVRKRAAFAQTTEDFASRTSIHGVAYMFDKSHGVMDRVLWALVVLGFLVLAYFFTATSWTQWRDDQVRKILSVDECALPTEERGNK